MRHTMLGQGSPRFGRLEMKLVFPSIKHQLFNPQSETSMRGRGGGTYMQSTEDPIANLAVSESRRSLRKDVNE